MSLKCTQIRHFQCVDKTIVKKECFNFKDFGKKNVFVELLTVWLYEIASVSIEWYHWYGVQYYCASYC